MLLEKPFFSVVIPLYNKAAHVARSVESVLNQTLHDFEIIIINDASTDNSMDEAQKYTDSRISFINRPEPGPGGYAARNLGIKKAKGDWVAFLDADDEWYPTHLEKMKKLIVQFPEVYFLSCGWNTRKCEHRKVNEYYKKNEKKEPHIISLKKYLSCCIDGARPVHTSIACINKKSPVAINLFPADNKAKRGGDQHAWLKMMCCHKQIAWSNHIGADYFLDSQNMVTKTAPSSHYLMTRDVYRELIYDMDADEKKLLKKEFNRMIKVGWINNLMCGNENFSLIKNIYWSVDLFNALLLALLSIMPTIVLKKAISIKRKLNNPFRSI